MTEQEGENRTSEVEGQLHIGPTVHPQVSGCRLSGGQVGSESCLKFFSGYSDLLSNETKNSDNNFKKRNNPIEELTIGYEQAFHKRTPTGH